MGVGAFASFFLRITQLCHCLFLSPYNLNFAASCGTHCQTKANTFGSFFFVNKSLSYSFFFPLLILLLLLPSFVFSNTSNYFSPFEIDRGWIVVLPELYVWEDKWINFISITMDCSFRFFLRYKVMDFGLLGLTWIQPETTCK